MIALAATVEGDFAIDLASGEVSAADPFEPEPGPKLNLPRLRATAESGSTVVALVDARPSILISHDAGATWRESGRGLPPGRAVAIAASDPDTIAYASAHRLYLSRDGGVFWTALDADLPEVECIALRES